jgi:hypothetical protein
MSKSDSSSARENISCFHGILILISLLIWGRHCILSWSDKFKSIFSHPFFFFFLCFYVLLTRSGYCISRSEEKHTTRPSTLLWALCPVPKQNTLLVLPPFCGPYFPFRSKTHYSSFHPFLGLLKPLCPWVPCSSTALGRQSADTVAHDPILKAVDSFVGHDTFFKLLSNVFISDIKRTMNEIEY